MKIDDRITLAEGKLAEERAKLQASAILDDQKDSKRITEVDKRRNDVRAELEIYPSLISEMESKIEALKKEKEDGILKQNLARQRKVAKEIEEKSQELVVTLGKADEINTSLRKLWEQHGDLAKLTNQSVVSPYSTSGSQGSLNQLYGIIRWEVEKGESRPSPRFLHPGPPI